MSTLTSPQMSKLFSLLQEQQHTIYHNTKLVKNFPGHDLSQQALRDKDQLIGQKHSFQTDHVKLHHKKKRKCFSMVSRKHFLQNNQYSLIYFKELIIPNYNFLCTNSYNLCRLVLVHLLVLFLYNIQQTQETYNSRQHQFCQNL